MKNYKENQNLSRPSDRKISDAFLKISFNAIFQNCDPSWKVRFERLGYAVSKGQGKNTYPHYGDGNFFLLYQ